MYRITQLNTTTDFAHKLKGKKTFGGKCSLSLSEFCSALLFLRLYLEQSDFQERFSGGDFSVDRSSQSVTCQTFELTLRSCLYPHIERRYIECCGNLMKTLKKDYK